MINIDLKEVFHKMPPRYVNTIREEIYYEYLKLESRSAFGTIRYGFITAKFKSLSDLGKREDLEKNILKTLDEWRIERVGYPACVFCGATGDIEADHLVPSSRGGRDIADNIVTACSACNSKRGNKGIFQWLGLKKKDHLHRLVAGKYLKQLLELHEEAGTLDIGRDNLTVLCARCKSADTCGEWGKEGELTCFCLESILP